MRDLLKQLRGSEYQGVKELADAAERFLREAGPTQGKGTVAEYPNERTVRYYISTGLLTSATEKRGLRSVFGYEHLLKLLTIKKLQADGLPISLIKDLISDKTIEDLEKLFGEDIRVFTDRPALESYQKATGDRDEVMELQFSSDAPPPTASKSKAREYLESLLLKPKQPVEKDMEVFYSLAPDPDAPTGDSWTRYEIIDGLELHARDDYELPSDPTVVKRIVERILAHIDSK
jgi:DNA-binding transcriptional MerR regulator